MVLAGALALALAIGGLLPEDRVFVLMREGGPIELLSAGFHFVLAITLAWFALRHGGVFLFLMVYALVLGARELDAQKAATSGSVTKLSYYLDPVVPWGEKLLVVALIVLLLAGTVRLIVRYSGSFRASLRRGDSAAWALAAGVLMLPALKVLDAVPRWTRDLTGAAIDDRGLAILLSLEETMELALPLVFLTALLHLWRSHPRADASPARHSER